MLLRETFLQTHLMLDKLIVNITTLTILIHKIGHINKMLDFQPETNYRMTLILQIFLKLFTNLMLTLSCFGLHSLLLNGQPSNLIILFIILGKKELFLLCSEVSTH